MDDLYRRWTISAVECYQRHCICNNCKYLYYCNNPIKKHNDYGIKPLKYAVLKLFSRHGAPNIGRIKNNNV